MVEADAGVAAWVYGHELAHPDESARCSSSSRRCRGTPGPEVMARLSLGPSSVPAFVREAGDRGCTEVWVLTEHDNEAAMTTYVSGGWTPGRGAPVMVTWKLA